LKAIAVFWLFRGVPSASRRRGEWRAPAHGGMSGLCPPGSGAAQPMGKKRPNFQCRVWEESSVVWGSLKSHLVFMCCLLGPWDKLHVGLGSGE